jgi:light-regulated signal transduction histidine kinase (bacteriophytochrome)
VLFRSERSRLALLDLAEDQKMTNEKIQGLNETLEKRVAARTAQLETSNKELEAFAYSVSHDLRAPLRAIDGYSRILQQEYAKNLDDEGLRLLGVVRDSTKTMDHLITDLLTLSRVGRSELNYSTVDMTSMVNIIYHELATPEVLKKFEFGVSSLPSVPGDQTLIRQVWVNLISNAIKYTMPKEKGVIEITGSSKDGFCTYTIKDNGVGFNPDFTNKLFGLFQRLHKARDFEGTGVGLAIVQRIITRHGGRVSGEGKVGSGATFTFSIPERLVNHE